MKVSSGLLALVATAFWDTALAKWTSHPTSFIDHKTNIPFTGHKAQYKGLDDEPRHTEGGVEIGIVIPPNENVRNEYLGHITTSRKGYTAISHGGQMTESLLLLFWTDGTTVRHSFRYAMDKNGLSFYQGSAKLYSYAMSLNDTHYQLTYRCVHCLEWHYQNETGRAETDVGAFLLGWAQATKGPRYPKYSNSPLGFHDVGYGMFPVDTELIRLPNYDKYISPKQIKRSEEQTDTTAEEKSRTRSEEISSPNSKKQLSTLTPNQSPPTQQDRILNLVSTNTPQDAMLSRDNGLTSTTSTVSKDIPHR
ncbi:CBD9-like protein [Microthyrium microscopicum]|uniref:CBD9-like protein n=1 Tax=Microthyrium microscopicum TaxID=703497 RepID=A0A6A6TUA9_9PEZI|nr:CBD9-like protein [Microthyrium microscopicum]